MKSNIANDTDDFLSTVLASKGACLRIANVVII